jgi:3-oxoacyl-[acyl-carrier protein] reductase
MLLENQIAVVTGGARGIGKAIALLMAKRSATVVTADLNTEGLEEVKAEAEAQGLPGRIVPKSLNVTDKEAVQAFVEEVIGEFEKIDILVNNAGITRDGLMLNMDDEQFDAVINVNLRSVFLMTRAVSRYMVTARYGRIVNLASVSGMMGNAGQCNYAASKAGVIGFTKTVAKELARRNVTCNAVAPGFINTDMTRVLSDKVKETVKKVIPCQKMGEAEDIAAGVAFLASPEAKYVTGQVLVVDGGLNM